MVFEETTEAGEIGTEAEEEDRMEEVSSAIDVKEKGTWQKTVWLQLL